jgi:hypothetical protein
VTDNVIGPYLGTAAMIVAFSILAVIFRWQPRRALFLSAIVLAVNVVVLTAVCLPIPVPALWLIFRWPVYQSVMVCATALIGYGWTCRAKD